MKLNEKSILSSVALAIAAVGVLWYMTVAIDHTVETRKNSNALDSTEQVSEGEPDLNPRFENLERTEELPLSNNPPANISPGAEGAEGIVPTL